MTSASTSRRTRILLAEEQPGSRDLIILVLSKLGYEIVAEPDLDHALDRMRKHACACVLLSATLTGGHGAESVRRLRSAAGDGRAPMILVLGGEDEALRRACLDAGARAYLLRPVEIDRLLRLVKEGGLARTSDAGTVAPPDPVIDLEHLFAFTDGDLQLERELSALFLSSAEVYLQRMADALRTGAPWRDTAHALKGASSNLGARRVAGLAREAEGAEPSESLLGALTAAVEEVRRCFDARQETGSP